MMKNDEKSNIEMFSSFPFSLILKPSQSLKLIRNHVFRHYLTAALAIPHTAGQAQTSSIMNRNNYVYVSMVTRHDMRLGIIIPASCALSYPLDTLLSHLYLTVYCKYMIIYSMCRCNHFSFPRLVY